jgi:hypothetical protein
VWVCGSVGVYVCCVCFNTPDGRADTRTQLGDTLTQLAFGNRPLHVTPLPKWVIDGCKVQLGGHKTV